MSSGWRGVAGTWTERLAAFSFAVVIVLSPLAARFDLLARPAPDVAPAYTDLLLPWAYVAMIVTIALWLLGVALRPRPLRFGPAFIWIPAVGLLAIVGLGTAVSIDPQAGVLQRGQAGGHDRHRLVRRERGGPARPDHPGRPGDGRVAGRDRDRPGGHPARDRPRLAPGAAVCAERAGGQHRGDRRRAALGPGLRPGIPPEHPGRRAGLRAPRHRERPGPRRGGRGWSGWRSSAWASRRSS